MKRLKSFLLITVINVILLFSYPINCYVVEAGWWEDLKTNTCKLFNSEVTEKWDGDDSQVEELMKQYPQYYIDGDNRSPYRGKVDIKDLNCSPPFHRYTGRTGCLLKDPVNNLGPTSSKTIYCAEAVDSNTSDPKLRVRLQFCNTVFCRTIDDVFTHGQCNVFAGSYGANLIRLCARIAYPSILLDNKEEGNKVKDKENKALEGKDKIYEDPLCEPNKDDEPGYTRCIHLDEHGRQQLDKLFEVKDKHGNIEKKIRILAPKLCLYNDPGLLSIEKTDIFDNSATSQPEHQHGYKFVKSYAYIKSLKDNKLLTDDQIAKLAINKEEVKKFGIDIKELLPPVFSIIYQLVEWGVGSADYNAKVESEILGCVELPLGVSPPPFYDTLDPKNHKFNITVQQICSTEQLKDMFDSTNNDKHSECIISNMRNNVIHNSIRISQDNLLPLCPSDNDEKTEQKFRAGECIKINSNDSSFHESLPKCSTGSNVMCVMHENSQNTNKNLRVLYSTVIESDQEADPVSLPKPFNYCIPICGQNRMCLAPNSTDNKTNCCKKYRWLCQKIWGVNAGNYDDIDLDFTNEAHFNSDQTALLKKFKFPDKSKQLVALITRKHMDINQNFLSGSSLSISNEDTKVLHKQTPDEICVYDVTSKYKLIGCVPRAQRPIPTVYQCPDKDNNHFMPKIGVKLSVKNKDDSEDILQGCVEAKNIHHILSNTTRPFNLNLAGYDYITYVTDEYNSITSAGAQTILGKYHTQQLKLNDINNVPYLGGFEKIDDAYVSGGKMVCVDSNYIGYSCNPRGNEFEKSLCVLSQKVKDTNCKKNKKIGVLEAKEECNDILSESIKDRIDPEFDASKCQENNSNYPGCFKLEKTSYHKIVDKTQYDKDAPNMRSKNSLELGLCIKIPEMPDCSGKTENNVIWSDAKVGEDSIGKCEPSNSEYDYVASPSEENLRRLCYFDPKKGSDIHFTSGNSPLPVLGPPKAECKAIRRGCARDESSANGVIWPETKPDKSAKPQCKDNSLKLINNLNYERKCVLDPSDKKYKFEAAPSSVYCVNHKYAKCSRISSEYDSNLIWPETGPDKSTKPQCKEGMELINDNNQERVCSFDENSKKYKFEAEPRSVHCVTPIPPIIVHFPTNCAKCVSYSIHPQRLNEGAVCGLLYDDPNETKSLDEIEMELDVQESTSAQYPFFNIAFLYTCDKIDYVQINGARQPNNALCNAGGRNISHRVFSETGSSQRELHCVFSAKIESTKIKIKIKLKEKFRKKDLFWFFIDASKDKWHFFKKTNLIN